MASDNTERNRKNGRKISRKQKLDVLLWERKIANNVTQSAIVLLETLESVVDGLTQMDGRYLINYTSARAGMRQAIKELKDIEEKLDEDISLAE